MNRNKKEPASIGATFVCLCEFTKSGKRALHPIRSITNLVGLPVDDEGLLGEVVGEELAGVADVDGRRLLVPGEHPDLDPR